MEDERVSLGFLFGLDIFFAIRIKTININTY